MEAVLLLQDGSLFGLASVESSLGGRMLEQRAQERASDLSEW